MRTIVTYETTSGDVKGGIVNAVHEKFIEPILKSRDREYGKIINIRPEEKGKIGSAKMRVQRRFDDAAVGRNVGR